MTNEHVTVTTVSDRGYLPAACCQLKSVWDHLAAKENIRLCLVICDVNAEDQHEVEQFFRDRSIAAEVLVCDDLANNIKPIATRWPRAAYLRLYFDFIFGPDNERLIYFDADTRVCAPLEPLLGANLYGAPVGAVHDFIYYVSGNIKRRRRDLFLAPDAPYLQSGVMIFDWPKTLADGGLERARRFLAEHPDRCLEAPDQDALNVAFEGKWTPLDPRWNLHELYLMFGGKLTPYLEHYTSSKPWSRLRPAAWREAAAWYTAELAGTAWADFIPPQSPIDILRERIGFFRYCYGWQIRDAVAKHAPFILDRADKPRIRPEDKPLPWAPKRRSDVEDMTQALILEAAQQCPRLLPPETVLGKRTER